jgi:hypothetical protein
MEPSGRKRRQRLPIGPGLKRLKSADRQPVATHGNGSGAHGKQG